MKFIQQKKFPKCLAWLPGLMLFAVATTGCAKLGLLTPQTSQVQVPVPVQVKTVTNQVTVIQTLTQTNGVTVTNTVTQTNPVTVVTWQTNVETVTVTNGYTPAASVTNALATAETINTLTGPFNPFSGSIAAILGLATAGLGYVAKLKTAQAQQNMSTAATVITAIENLEPAVAGGVKAAVQAQAIKSGTADTVHAVVQAVTNGIPA